MSDFFDIREGTFYQLDQEESHVKEDNDLIFIVTNFYGNLHLVSINDGSVFNVSLSAESTPERIIYKYNDYKLVFKPFRGFYVINAL